MLRQGNCVKRGYGATSLSLQAEAGHSFLLRRIYCEANSADTYLILRVDRKTVGVYRTYGRGGNQLGYIKDSTFPLNLMEYLESKGINVAIPIAEGQTFTIDSINAATEIVFAFDDYDAGDIRADMVNGTDSKEYNFLQYMTGSATLSASGDMLLDTSLSPAEFPDFPCDAVVPAKHSIKLLGLVGNPYAQGFGSNTTHTTYVKLIKDRETLFDPDRNGILFRGQASGGHRDSYQTDFSLIGGCHDGTQESQKADIGFPLLFEPALEFVSGEELLAYITFEQDGSETVEVTYPDLAAILNVKIG